MKTLFQLIAILLVPISLFSQQVTDNNGVYSLDPPILDIQGSTARIVHGTNPMYYSFPVNGPSAPITSPKSYDQYSYAPVHVALGGNGNSVYLPYIDYATSASSYQLKYVMSGDNGSFWSTSTRIDSLTTGSSISTYEDNLQLKVSSKGILYCVWRNQADTNAMYLAISSSGVGFGPRQRLPIGSPASAASNVSLKTLTIGGTDNLFLTYCTDSTLYFIRSTNEGATFGSPKVVTRISGMGGYFTGTKIVGNDAGKMYVITGFWQMGQHIPGEMPTDKSGTILLTSSDFGANWTFVDTLARSAWSGIQLMMTSTGSLVSVTAESSNVNLRSSLNGKLWSAPERINSIPGSATGMWDFGVSSVLVDDITIAVAWVDTSSGGYEEIFYRKMAVPSPPVTGVDDLNERSLPTTITLEQNYPNPFNPETVVRYHIPVISNQSSVVSVKIYDLLGREVAVLVNEAQAPGTYAVRFDASNLQSGTYFYRLFAAGSQAVRKMVVLK